MQRNALVWIMIALLMPCVSLNAMAQDDSPPPAAKDVEHSADVLDPPPLPKLEKSDWTSKKKVFSDALSVEDEAGDDLGKTLDLPGTAYDAHIDRSQPETEAEADEDPIYRVTSAYEQTLSEKYFDYRVKLPDSPYYLSGAAEDGVDGGVYGQSVIGQGQLRFIAVSDSKGDIEIFVSDPVSVMDLLQKIAAKEPAPAKDQNVTPAP